MDLGTLEPDFMDVVLRRLNSSNKKSYGAFKPQQIEALEEVKSRDLLV